MKLVVRNIGTDVAPDFRVFSENGEEIENVTSVAAEADVDDFGVTRCRMSWMIMRVGPSLLPSAANRRVGQAFAPC